MTSPRQILPVSYIAKTKAEGKEQYYMAKSMRDQQQLVMYTDGSVIIRKIGALAVASYFSVIRKTFLGLTTLYIVYQRDLQDTTLALSITLNKLVRGIKRATIFIDNQSSICSSCNLNRQSRQRILQYIVNSIDAPRAQGIEVMLQQMPAHMRVKENKLADIAAKQAMAWRVVRKRNQRLKEINT